MFITNITDVQKKVKVKPLADGGGQDLEVGSMVYSVDKSVYRARAEEMIGEENLFR